MKRLSSEAHNLNWLVANFAEDVAGVREAAVVSSDGLLIAASEGLGRAEADRLAAVAAGLISIARGASGPIDAGRVNEVIIEYDWSLLFVMRISEGSALTVVASRPCDVGQIGYEMAVLVEKTEAALSPNLIDELKATLPR
jgi:predicted regulator of Ras-like GTPase activity (Roadblock/LC7/MglB family)